jgi:predicted dehydrogenase
MQKKVNVGMIGSGFMGRMHTNAFSRANSFFQLDHKFCPKVVCTKDGNKAIEFAKRWSWQETETDWRQLIDRKDIDLIDICVPNHLHCEIANAALSAGKMVATEKPLAMNSEEGRKMVEAENKSGKKNHGLVQSETIPGSHASQAGYRQRRPRAYFSLQSHLSPRLDH